MKNARISQISFFILLFPLLLRKPSFKNALGAEEKNALKVKMVKSLKGKSTFAQRESENILKGMNGYVSSTFQKTHFSNGGCCLLQPIPKLF